MNEFLFLFPNNISNILYKNIEKINNLEEVRIRNEKPIILKFSGEEKVIDYIVNR